MKYNYSELAGAIREGDAIKFSVWAPNAESVAVAGNFNDWNPESSVLERGDDDVWRGSVQCDSPCGSEYKFVIRNNGNTLWKNDPRARALTNSVGNGIVVEDSTFDWGNDHEFTMAPWNELVIYELHLGTYFRSEEKESVGTFDDAIKRLDHIAGLGINCIELMPVAEFAGDQSWGYNPAFPFAVESDYAGVDGLKRFVKACHEKGIAVLIDVVYNHFGPSDLDMWQFDGWEENGMGGIYFYNDWRANTPWGDTRPDYGRQEVRRYIRDNALMWLDRYHADGLRLDMTFYVRSVNDGAEIPEGWSLSQWINNDIQENFPGKICIAEDLRSNEWLTKSTEEGGAGFNSQWDEQFVHPVREVLTTQEDEHRSIETIAKAVTFVYNGDPFQRVIYTESHDEVANGKSRVPTEIDEFDQEGYWARKRSILGACLTMTSPGIPMIFQGQEFLATGHFEDGHEMTWDVCPHKEGVIRIYRDLIRLRTQLPGLQSAIVEITHMNTEDKIIAYARGEGSEQVFVVMSFSQLQRSDYRVGFPQPGAWKLQFHADASSYGDDFGDTPLHDTSTEEVECQGWPWSAELFLGSYDCAVFSKAD